MTVWRLVTHHTSSEAATNDVRENEEIGMGWNLLGDLNEYGSAKEISAAAKELYPHDSNAGFAGPQLWNFSHEMKVGDLVVVTAGERRVLVAEVTGDYYFEAGQVGDDRQLNRRAAIVTDYDPEAIWTHAAGVAEGQGVKWSLVRCQREVSEAEAAKFVRAAAGAPKRASSTPRAKSTSPRAPRASKEAAVVPPEKQLVVVNVGPNLYEFTNHSIYTCPSGKTEFHPNHTHQPAKYAGIYFTKGLPALAEIQAVVRLTSAAEGTVLWKFVSTSDEELVMDARKRYLTAVGPDSGKLANEPPCLVFLFANKRRTELIYSPHGGLTGNRQYLNLSDMKFSNVDELGDQLRKYNWTSLPKIKV